MKEINTTMKKCRLCKSPIIRTSPRANNVAYCSTQCRNKHYKATKPYLSKEAIDARNHAKWNKYARGKIQCLICDGWYRAPLHHAWQRHRINEFDYKEHFGLDRKKGLLTPRLKEIKRAWVFANGTVENLKKGKPFRFVPGDTHAGRYERRPQTLARLKKQFKHT